MICLKKFFHAIHHNFWGLSLSANPHPLKKHKIAQKQEEKWIEANFFFQEAEIRVFDGEFDGNKIFIIWDGPGTEKIGFL